MNMPSSVGDMCDFLRFGSPADRVGPVVLRPRLASGLPLSTSETRWWGQYPHSWVVLCIARSAGSA